MNTNLAIVLFAPMVAALNPALLAAVFVMILLPNPQRLMLGYLAGAYAIGIAVSLVIVLSLHGSGFATTSSHILGPGEYIAAGVTALTIAFVLAARLEGPLQKCPQSQDVITVRYSADDRRWSRSAWCA